MSRDEERAARTEPWTRDDWLFLAFALLAAAVAGSAAGYVLYALLGPDR